MPDEPTSDKKRLRVLISTLIAVLVVAAGVLVSDRLENKVRPGRTPDAELPGDRYTCTSFTDSLRMEKAVLRRWDFDDMASVDTRTPLYFLYNMNWMRRKLTDFLRVPGVDPAHSYRGMRFVELGPGPSLSVGVLALMAGAEHYDGLEVAEYGFVHDALPVRRAGGPHRGQSFLHASARSSRSSPSARAARFDSTRLASTSTRRAPPRTSVWRTRGARWPRKASTSSSRSRCSSTSPISRLPSSA